MEIASSQNVKPATPRPAELSGTPLRLHANGQWYRARRIGGKVRFFYYGKEPREAKRLYLLDAPAIEEGRMPSPAAIDVGSITLLELVDRFVCSREEKLLAGDIGERHFQTMKDDAARFLNWGGPNTHVAALGDLQGFRTRMATLGTYAFNRTMQVVRLLLRWGYKHKPPLIAEPMYELEALEPRNRKAVRRERRERDAEHGVPEFDAAEARNLVARAIEWSERRADALAWILLGLNGGVGQSHLGDLPEGEVDLAAGRIDWVRTKTEELFQMPLWPTTALAIRAALRERPKAADAAARGLLFRTASGLPVVRDVRGNNGRILTDDRVAETFGRLERLLARPADADRDEEKRRSMHRHGRGFYGLRRTFAKLADNAADPNARRRVMGQAFQGQDPNYLRGTLPWARLQAVTDCVHVGLFGVKPQELTSLEALAEVVGEPVLMPIKSGWTKGRPRPELAERNRQRWAAHRRGEGPRPGEKAACGGRGKR